MKRVVPFYSWFYIFLLLVGLCGLLLLCVITTGNNSHVDATDMAIVIFLIMDFSALIVIAVVCIFQGFSAATYSADKEGMTVCIRKKTFRLRWKECVEFGIAKATVNRGSTILIVYCTTKILSEKERSNFLWYRKNDYAHTLYFQYVNKEDLLEFLQFLPKNGRVQLETQASQYHLI